MLALAERIDPGAFAVLRERIASPEALLLACAYPAFSGYLVKQKSEAKSLLPLSSADAC